MQLMSACALQAAAGKIKSYNDDIKEKLSDGI